MDRRTTSLVLFTLSLTSGIAGLPATTSAAEGPIGVAAVVRNTVSQLEPRATRIAKGDEVVRNEVVRTAADSDARLVFRDDTNLSLGPGSTLKLDRTVFDDPKPGDIAIKLTQGAFRFVTGNSEKEAYVIKTPIATMGVRGTTLDILVQRRRNKIVLGAGKATICVPGKCVDLIHEGDSVNITSDGKSVNVDVQNGSDWTFDGACNGGLCGTSTFADAGQNIITGSLARLLLFRPSFRRAIPPKCQEPLQKPLLFASGCDRSIQPRPVAFCLLAASSYSLKRCLNSRF